MSIPLPIRLVVPLFFFTTSYAVFAQSGLSKAPITPPAPLSTTLTAQQKAALTNKTSVQEDAIRRIITPKLEAIVKTGQQSSIGTFRSWKDIIANAPVPATASVSTKVARNVSAASVAMPFTDVTGVVHTFSPKLREYHPALNKTAASATPAATGWKPMANLGVTPSIRIVQPDQDGDGLGDNPACDCDFEGNLAAVFMPNYGISTGEQQQFANYGDYVPWTVTGTVGTTPPNSYYHVSPLGLATDVNGTQVYAMRIDYLSLWNADGGLIGGDAACFYSYFGLDSVIYQLLSHNLDAERSVMLVAAPLVNGTFDPNPNNYSLYTIYTGSHEGTFFDQSTYADFSPAVPANNHVNLAQALSKHSTYGFNPDYYPITPGWFIASTNAGITASWVAGEIDDGTYLLLTAMANDTFYGCLVERFGDQGVQAPNPRTNVGEVSTPINASHFIQDNSDAGLHLADKLTQPVF